VSDTLKHESVCAVVAKRRALNVARRVRGVANACTLAEQQATRAAEELWLYKLQLEQAQREIYRA
jgi:hypothetical protein